MTDTLLIPLRRVYQIPGDKETETKTRDFRLHMTCILSVAIFTVTKYCTECHFLIVMKICK